MRYERCEIRLDKEKVIRHIKFNYGSVAAYVKFRKISRTRFYEIINNPHQTKNMPSLMQLSSDLKINIDELVK